MEAGPTVDRSAHNSFSFEIDGHHLVAVGAGAKLNAEPSRDGTVSNTAWTRVDQSSGRTDALVVAGRAIPNGVKREKHAASSHVRDRD